ncbi:MAG: sugar phosphate isomerase/epimerase [Pseudomonadota bacterium]
MTVPQLILAAGTVQATPLLDRLAPARAAGFAGISIFAGDLEAVAADGIGLPEVRSRIADAGLFVTEIEIVGNWLPGTPTKDNPAWLTALLDRSTGERLTDLAEAIGARGITVAELQGIACDTAVAADAFARLCETADGAGLHVALEFVPTGGIPDLAAAWDIVRAADRANGGLLVDSWHLFRSGSDLAQLAALPAGAIKSIQICDAPAVAEADLDREMVRGRLLPGEGDLDLAGFVAAVRATGTAAPWSVEIFSDQLAREPIDIVARRCAAAAMQLLGERHHG